MRIQIHQLTELKKLTTRLAHLLKGGDLLLFEGEIGAGKTTAIAYLSNALKSSDTPSSPTFTLVNHYHGRDCGIYHLDLYRLNSEDELYSIDIDRYLYNPDNIVLIEWADRLWSLTPDTYLKIVVHYVDAHTRDFEFIARGARYEQIVSKLN